jgi:hypothetical protein
VGGGYRAVAGGRRTFATLALLVVSHWVLDYITHRADLPLYPGGPKFGLGLWNSVPGTVIVESAMFAAGVWMYARSTRARDAAGRWGWRALVAILAILYVVNLVSPPPPSVAAIWIVALVMSVVFVAWAWWVDHHRDHQLSRRT